MNMGLAEHSSIIEVGRPTIDAQHKRIFELAARLAHDGDQARMMHAITVLCEHVKSHFREEEEMMAACAFPDLETHRRQHEECRTMLIKLLDTAPRMSLDEVAEQVKQLVNGWLYNHILTADFAYLPYVRPVSDTDWLDSRKASDTPR